MNVLAHSISKLALAAGVVTSVVTGVMVAVLFTPVEVNAQTVPGNAPTEVKQSLVLQLEQRDQEIKQLLGDDPAADSEAIEGDQRDALGRLVFDLLDAKALAAYALQDTFDIISDEDRQEFVDLFARILRDQSLANLDIYRAEITYDSVSVARTEQLRPTVELDDITYVAYTKAKFEDVETPVLYIMAKDDPEQGERDNADHADHTSWRILDMSIDDVYTAESYRRQFQSIMRRRGFQPLLESLQRRADRI
ncbi:MAG: ABC transporter substrate-binding protein [Balneolaceae bacterium]|nr:ABC transporter substrate-binding protein [Balneolaceae bacterium]